MLTRCGWYGTYALGVVLALATVVQADNVNLEELIAGGGTVLSGDGTVEFGGFSYTPTLFAPEANAIHVLTGADVPGGCDIPSGFAVQGPFQAVVGLDLSALLGFTANVVADGGYFVSAESKLVNSDAIGIGSSAVVTSTIDSLENASQESLSVFDTSVDGGDVKTNLASLAGFGGSIEVLDGIGLVTFPPSAAGGPALANVFLFTHDFANVPEPATGALLVLASAVLIRRRGRRR